MLNRYAFLSTKDNNNKFIAIYEIFLKCDHFYIGLSNTGQYIACNRLGVYK